MVAFELVKDQVGVLKDGAPAELGDDHHSHHRSLGAANLKKLLVGKPELISSRGKRLATCLEVEGNIRVQSRPSLSVSRRKRQQG